MNEFIYCQPAVVGVSLGTRVTQLAFKKRFPPSKWKAARGMAVPGSDLFDFFEDWEHATYIDLAQPEMADTLAKLSSRAIPEIIRLTAAEVAAVLSAPVTEYEVFVE